MMNNHYSSSSHIRDRSNQENQHDASSYSAAKREVTVLMKIAMSTITYLLLPEMLKLVRLTEKITPPYPILTIK